jgi:hypothetical protein
VQVIQSFFHDPNWTAEYDDTIPETLEELESLEPDGSFWRASEIRRLAALYPILNKLNGAWELCLDWIQPFKGLPYSVGILGIRCGMYRLMAVSCGQGMELFVCASALCLHQCSAVPLDACGAACQHLVVLGQLQHYGWQFPFQLLCHSSRKTLALLLPCRCAKRHEAVRCKAVNYRVLAVIPGPSIPKNLRLSDTVRDFRRYGVKTEGMEVRLWTSAGFDTCGGSSQVRFYHRKRIVLVPVLVQHVRALSTACGGMHLKTS